MLSSLQCMDSLMVFTRCLFYRIHMTLTTPHVNDNLLLGSNCNPMERTEMLTNIDYLRQTTES